MEGLIRKTMIIGIIIAWIVTSLGPINLLMNNDSSNTSSNESNSSQYNGIGSNQSEFTTTNVGVYFVGSSPSEYVSGEEQPYNIKKDGSYVAGTDFSPGVYDIGVTSGSGKVTLLDSFNEVLYDGQMNFNQEITPQTWDNIPIANGYTIKAEGVQLFLEPQTNDVEYIKQGTYNIMALSPKGHILIVDENDNIVLEDDIGTNSYEVGTYGLANVNLKNGYIVINLNVALQLIPSIQENNTPGENITK